MNAAEHLEQHLGVIAQGWSSAFTPDVKVCLFRDRPAPGVDTLATLGLSKFIIRMSQDRTVRQELLLAIRRDNRPEHFAKLLLHIADQIVSSGQALLRGDAIEVDAAIADGSNANALYASIPVVFPDALATLQDSSPPTVFVWLFPIVPKEHALIRSRGWNEFESLLEEATPDLFDVHRQGVI